MQVSLHWSDYTVTFREYLDNGDFRSSSLKIVGVALLSAG